MNDIRHSRFWKSACFLTRTDLDLLAESNAFDRATVAWTLIALVLAFALHTFLWSKVAGLLVDNAALAVVSGAFIASLICTLEVAMAASDWGLKGVLADRGLDRAVLARVAVRIGIALFLSYATSLAFAQWLHGPELLARQEADRRAANAPLVDEARREKARLQAQLVEPQERVLADREAALATARARVEEARQELGIASEHAHSAELEVQRELTGLDRPKGDGPRHKDAMLREQQARARIATSLKRQQEWSHEVSRLEREIDSARVELKRSAAEFESKAAEVDARIAKDDRFVARRDSLLTRYLQLEQLYQDREVGRAARELHWTVQLTLICLELILVAVKVVFAPASIYQVRLIARTRIEAAQINRETAQRLADLGLRPKLRIVGRSETNPDHPDGVEA